MYFPLTISIPEPCHEDWHKMTPVEFNQRHCLACDRVLTDFSSMTDVQIGSHLRRHEGQLCGRFRADQLNRTVRIGGPRRFGGLRAAAAAAGLLFSAPVLAQVPTPHPVEQRENPAPSGPRSSPRVVTITGTVLEEGSLDYTLPGASILLKGTTTGTVADIEGRYQLRLPADRPATLVISYVGYETTEKHFSVAELAKAGESHGVLESKLTVVPSPEALTGAMVISYVHRPSLLENLMVHPVKAIYSADTPTGPAKQGDWKDYWREKFAAAKARRIEHRRARAENRAAREVSASTQAGHSGSAPVVNRTSGAPVPNLNLTASPNPFTDELRVSFELPSPQKYTLDLLSSTGKTIIALTGEGTSGRQEVALRQKVASLPSGSYFLHLRTALGSFTVITVVR